VEIGRVRFARIKSDNDPLVSRIDFYVVDPFDFQEWAPELSESAMVILTLGGDFDRFQNCVVRALREERVGRIGIVWSCRVHIFLFI
jgi:hypothetical protein